MPTSPDPTQGPGFPPDFTASADISAKLRTLQESINELQQQLAEIIDEIEKSSGDPDQGAK